ncbi:MAG: D-alanyl-D-alanine carboxypeptidase/D-alanyl-D-alanine endopeptidase, partial [Bryobacteraceae bacterium]
MARIQNRRLIAAFAIAPAFAAGLPEKVQELLESSPIAARAFVGIRIDTVAGETLVDHNADRFFVPASNMKLFTTALALLRLGPDHRFHTLITAPAPPDSTGRLRGPLTFAGGGDPNLSGREIPYRVDAPRGNPLAALDDLAAQVYARGVRRVDGDIVGDDTLWPFDPIAAGWTIDDPLNDYGAPVSALSIGDNTITLTLGPGDPAHITLNPPVDYFHIDNRVREGAPQRIRLERDPGSRFLRVWGLLPPRNAGETHRIAVDDPALFAAVALRDALTRRGVAVHGEPAARHHFPSDPAPAT